MITALIALGVLVALVAVLGLWVAGIYNKLVDLRNRFKNAFAQIDVQLKRRYDLIPNLVEVAKGYMKHESSTLEAVIKARNIALAASQAAAANPADANAMKGLLSAEAGLGGALSRLMVVSEQYPDLKANTNMLQLTEELTSTENKVSFARQAYNDSVMIYNTAREVFPSVIFAGMFGFTAAELFKIDDPTERNAPKVQFYLSRSTLRIAHPALSPRPSPLVSAIMQSTYTAIIKHDAGWWIGWIEEVPGVNAQEKTKEALLTSLGVVLKEALEFNRDEARKAAAGDFSEEPVIV